MQIKNIFGTTIQEIESKKYNIFLGISIGNKYFTTENIKEYIFWMLKNTKEYIALIIADEIQAINYEIFDHINHEQALKKALSEGQKIKENIQELIKELPQEKQDKIFIVRWQDIKDFYYNQKIKIILEEFENNKEFHNFVIKNVKINLGSRRKGLSNEEINYLAAYLLDEIPIVINGIKIKNIVFDLHPYPGKGISKIFVDLQEGKIFPKLTKKLEINHKIASIEMYI